jgi:hypothetical protein
MTLMKTPPFALLQCICVSVSCVCPDFPHAALDCRYGAAALWSPRLVASEGASRLLTLASR